jgi:hypothetical protein
MIAAVLLTYCGSGSAPSSKDDIKADAKTDISELLETELLPFETEQEEETADTEPEEQLLCDTEPFQFGCPCKSNDECASFSCMWTMNGKICTKQCAAEACPKGWECASVTVGGELYYWCVPQFLFVCSPCETDSDCFSEFSATGAKCLSKGKDGKFCGGDCSKYGECPDGYKCEDIEGSKQCVPESGECTCTPFAIEHQKKTNCYKENSFGKCEGLRVCTTGGLTPCDADEPMDEICDNKDNNCNGKIDEVEGKFDCKIEKPGIGTCPGKGDCINGKLLCEPLIPGTPKPEVCNGIDDDCNGKTDDGICYDGNDCTKDICDQGSGKCVFEAMEGDCNDQNACTLNDHCQGGQCLAGKMKNCDDSNTCTDDSCDTKTGDCLHTKKNSGTCDDGDKCTIGDSCKDGQCISGTPKTCVPDTPCLKDGFCSKTDGQCHFTNNDGLKCDDGDDCKVNDVCSGGQCVGPDSYCYQPGAQTNCAPGSIITACTCVVILSPTCLCLCL